MPLRERIVDVDHEAELRHLEFLQPENIYSIEKMEDDRPNSGRDQPTY